MRPALRTLALFALPFCFSLAAYGQCEGCPSLEGGAADFCFTDERFPEKCAQFVDGAPEFFVNRNAKKNKALPVTLAADTEYFLNLVRERKNKIDAEEALFLQLALEAWAVEERRIGYEALTEKLEVKYRERGEGPKPKAGQTVTVHYTGWLEDGTKFDSSVDRGEPFKFPLGRGRVIKGWDEGVAEMPVGSKALLRIPSDMAYGARDRGPIPANSTLVFEIEVLSAE